MIRFILGSVQLTELPPRGIALDGAVQGPTAGDPLDRWSFDHHAGCVRLFTAATCQQVADAIALGFDPRGRQVVINDLDADTVLAVWLLRHPERVSEARTRAFVQAVGVIDAHGPAGVAMLAQRYAGIVDWMRGPLGGLLGRDVQSRRAEWPELLEQAVCLVGDAVEREWPAAGVALGGIPFHILRESDHIVMVEAEGFGAFAPLYESGYRVVIVASPPRDDGSRVVTVGKRSDVVPYNITRLLERLGDEEPGWGGGSSIGGSPRPSGTRLTPNQLWAAALSVAGGGEAGEVVFCARIRRADAPDVIHTWAGWGTHVQIGSTDTLVVGQKPSAMHSPTYRQRWSVTLWTDHGMGDGMEPAPVPSFRLGVDVRYVGSCIQVRRGAWAFAPCESCGSDEGAPDGYGCTAPRCSY